MLFYYFYELIKMKLCDLKGIKVASVESFGKPTRHIQPVDMIRMMELLLIRYETRRQFSFSLSSQDLESFTAGG